MWHVPNNGISNTRRSWDFTIKKDPGEQPGLFYLKNLLNTEKVIQWNCPLK
jgi:hypothetical protein